MYNITEKNIGFILTTNKYAQQQTEHLNMEFLVANKYSEKVN